METLTVGRFVLFIILIILGGRMLYEAYWRRQFVRIFGFEPHHPYELKRVYEHLCALHVEAIQEVNPDGQGARWNFWPPYFTIRLIYTRASKEQQYLRARRALIVFGRI